MMQVSKKIPFDDVNVLNGIRALYIVSNLIIAGIYFYVRQQINKKKGTIRQSQSHASARHTSFANVFTYQT